MNPDKKRMFKTLRNLIPLDKLSDKDLIHAFEVRPSEKVIVHGDVSPEIFELLAQALASLNLTERHGMSDMEFSRPKN